MLTLFFFAKVASAVEMAMAGADDAQANSSFCVKAGSVGRSERSSSTVAPKSATRAIKRVVKTVRSKQRSVSDQLVDLARAKGDTAFIEREIKTHLEAIALYENEAGSSDAQLRAFAQRILPQLQRHLSLLRSLKTGN